MQHDVCPVQVKRQMIEFNPDESRVVNKPFIPVKERVSVIIKRVAKLSDEKVKKLLEQTVSNFEKRHHDIKRIFKNNFDLVVSDSDFSLERKLLIGSYFTMEYSIESAALFNPSVVKHPDQGDLESDEQRVIISFRAVGEGHISSIVFREGIIRKDGQVDLEPNSPIVERGKITHDPIYKKKNFILKLKEIGHYDLVETILDDLLDDFTMSELKESIDSFKKTSQLSSSHLTAIEAMTWLADSTYQILYDNKNPLSSRVVFPFSDNEKKGLEDARFVKFTDLDESEVYYATYSAYSGTTVLPQLIRTRDFINFKVTTLIGSGSQNKGMALFPEKINGKFAMISRQDNENIYIMFSDNIRYWEEYSLLREPEQYWEFFQIGNCGSPIRTEKGWLLLTHGVGAVRTYCIGALLLDLDDPSKVIGCTKEPILFPSEMERNGYVPNVVYSCGGIDHKDMLILPYAMSDTRSGIATVNLPELVDYMLACGK